MPVRKIPKNFRSLTGSFYSLKNKQSLLFESKLERDFFLTLEFDSEVTGYEEQPVRLRYSRNGRTYPYTPDCIVHYKDKLSCIVEVKYSDEIKEKKVFLKQKFDQIEEYLENNDFTFKLFSELDVDMVVLENMHFIYNYVTIRNQDKVLEIGKLLDTLKNITYSDLLSTISSDAYQRAEYIPYIWYMVLIGKLKIDMHKKISQDTLLEVIK